jgi:folate-binding protein YgfZ
MTHFGDPFGEQRTLEAGHGFVRLDRALLQVTGSDRIGWLDSLTSHRIVSQANTEALILDPHGHVEHDLHVVDTDGTTWLIVAVETAGALRDYLDSMRFMMDVAVADVSDQYAVFWVPRRELAEGHPTWLVPLEFAGLGTTASGSDRGGAADKYVPARPGRLIGAEVIRSVGQQPDGPECGVWALEALRIAAGVPRMGADTDARTLPHEIGLIGPAVHLAKGCYRGQETVARLHNMGRPPRRLVLVHFDGALPDPGAEVVRGEKVVGRVGSVAQHYELGPIGLAVIKRSVPIEEQLQAGGIALSQEEIVSAAL